MPTIMLIHNPAHETSGSEITPQQEYWPPKGTTVEMLWSDGSIS